MVDFNMVFVGFAVVVAVCLFVYNGFYGGSYYRLSDSAIGDVYHLEYEQPLTGESKRYFVKVIEPVNYISDHHRNLLDKRSNYRKYDSNFKRTSHIVTCATKDGIRQFYCERVKNCKKVPFGRLLFTK